VKLDQLKAVQAVVETGSVKAASERLNKTQPAVSQALKAIEFQTGAELFDRSGYRLELTPLGQRVYLQSLRVLAEAEDLAQLVRHFGKGNEEKITVAVDDNTNVELLAPALRDLQDLYPETRVVLRTEILSGTEKMIKEGVADIAIAPMIPVLLEEQGFDYMPVFQSTMHNVTAPSLWEEMRTAKKVSDLRRFHQILVSDTGDSEGMFNREFGVQKGQRRWYVSDLHIKKHLLLNGLGWGRLPEHLVADALAAGKLLEIELEHTHLALNLEFFAFRMSKPATGPVATSLWNNLNAIAK
jgi:DNA-binding transcriptional LysR family regulator